MKREIHQIALTFMPQEEKCLPLAGFAEWLYQNLDLFEKSKNPISPNVKKISM